MEGEYDFANRQEGIRRYLICESYREECVSRGDSKLAKAWRRRGYVMLHWEKHRQQSMARFLDRKDFYNKKARTWKAKNREKNLNILKSWRDNNRPKIAAYGKVYKAKRMEDPAFRAIKFLRNRIWQIVKNLKCKKSKSGIELIGCPASFLRYHLECQFKPGMTWDNYGKWHIDHIVPCASFDLSNPDQQKQCFHYSNLQPLWAIDNLRKGTKLRPPPGVNQPRSISNSR